MANVAKILTEVALEFGLDPQTFAALAGIESGFNPKARAGSYRGLFQLSKREFNKYGSGNILNAEDNAKAAAKKMKADQKYFKNEVGRNPSATELYLMHQQGRAGLAAHSAKPEEVAWKNIRPFYSDQAAKARGFKSGDAYAKAAVWGNLPAQAKKRFGSVDNVTSADFIKWWDGRVTRGLRRRGVEFNELTGIPEIPSRKQAISDAQISTERSDIVAKMQDRLEPRPEQAGLIPGSAVTNVDAPPPEAVPRIQESLPAFETTIEGGDKFFTPERLDQVFGRPFGELFQNEATPSQFKQSVRSLIGADKKPLLPAAPPTLRQFFFGLFR
jgi:hypothetical protein